MNWLKKKLKLIDDIINDFLTDIKSLRYQLVLAAYAFNIYVIQHRPEQLAWSIGLLTAVYGLYFVSKHHEAVMRNEKDIKTVPSPAGNIDPD